MAASPAEAAPSAATLKLHPVLDVNAAAGLVGELLTRRGQAIRLDAGEVERLGAQCLQVLLSARASWAEDGLAFEVVAQSEPFAAHATIMGAAFAPDHAMAEPAQ